MFDYRDLNITPCYKWPPETPSASARVYESVTRDASMMSLVDCGYDLVDFYGYDLVDLDDLEMYEYTFEDIAAISSEVSDISYAESFIKTAIT